MLMSLYVDGGAGSNPLLLAVTSSTDNVGGFQLIVLNGSTLQQIGPVVYDSRQDTTDVSSTACGLTLCTLIPDTKART